jgi:AraC-like DNA-binding protein
LRPRLLKQTLVDVPALGARLLSALPMLAQGAPVAKVARAVGYATPSAFGAMFRRVYGTSPARYFSAR